MPAVRTGNLVYTAGPAADGGGRAARTGKVGAEVTPEEGKALARVCALNALGRRALAGRHRRRHPGGQGRRVRRVRAGFHGQPGVINGASELFGEVFGEAGAHARSAVGVSELPLDAPVEVELIVEVE